MNKYQIPVSKDAKKLFAHARPVAPEGLCGYCNDVNWHRYCEPCTKAIVDDELHYCQVCKSHWLVDDSQLDIEGHGCNCPDEVVPEEGDRSEHEEFLRDVRANDE